jgi:BMFP domain-containing protein YqiC
MTPYNQTLLEKENMMDPKILDDIARQLSAAVPADLQKLRDDLHKNFRAILDNAFSRMSLVTRDEFDAQQSVLNRTREKLEALEERLKEMEKNL